MIVMIMYDINKNIFKNLKQEREEWDEIEDVLLKIIELNKKNLKSRDCQQKIDEILKGRNDSFVRNKKFLNFYYWATNLGIKHLYKYLDIKTFKEFNELFVIPNFLILQFKCKTCKTCNMTYAPTSRTNRNRFVTDYKGVHTEKNMQCKECDEVDKADKEKQKKLKKSGKERKKRKRKTDKSPNIIVSKYENDYIIKLQEMELIKELSDEEKKIINQLLFLDKKCRCTYHSTTEMSNESKVLIKNNKHKDFVSTPFFINFYYWFTTLRISDLEIITPYYMDMIEGELVVKDGKNTDTPTSRHGSMFKRYCEFQSWLQKKHNEEELTIDKLFKKKTFDKFENINKDLNKLKYMPYKEYLQTDHWKLTRKKKLRESKYKCQLCGSKGELHVHHNTYERRGEEDLSDLVVLCSDCHAKFHNIDIDDNVDNSSNTYNIENKFIEDKEEFEKWLFKMYKTFKEFKGVCA